MYDIIVLAVENTLYLQQWNDEHQLDDKERNFLELVKACEDVSVNRNLNRLVRILSEKRLLNMYAVVERDKSLAENLWEEAKEISIETMEQAVFKKTYSKRVVFDKSFEQYRSFKYVAFNTNGMGLRQYGDFCINYNRHKTHIVFFAKESLKYITDDNEFDIQLFKKEICLNQLLPILVLKKYSNYFEQSDLNFTDTCKSEDYIEGVVLSDLNVVDIKNIVILRKDYEKFFLRYFDKYGGPPLDDSDKDEINYFTWMLDLIKEYKITLKVI